MAEKNDGTANKPFYENIVSKRTRADKKGSETKERDRSERESRVGSRRPGSRPEGPAAPRRGEGPSRGRPSGESRPAARSGTRPGSGERFGRDDRTVSGSRAAGGDRPARFARGDAAAPGKRVPGGDRPARFDRPRPGDEAHSRAPRRDGNGAPEARKSRRPSFAPPRELAPVFADLLPETKALLDSFWDIAQAVLPLDSKRLQALPQDVRELSHALTDERGDRRVGYMNEPATLSAYVRYFQWWNLVRLTRLFSGLTLELKDGDAAVDLGSGPLTLPIALWMARPDLRKAKLTWYCVDISQASLSLGEELFLSLAAKTGDEPWQIVRVKGECGVSLRRRVAFVASANMFNELFWDNPAPLEQQAKHHAKDLESYADGDASILIVEPGVPRAARFVSLLRDAFIRSGFSVASPCPHALVCPFPGLKKGKWCHFVLDTADAPARLHKLSEDSGLSKDRAALSFVFAARSSAPAGDAPADEVAAPSTDSETVSRLASLFSGLAVRVTSDPIRLPDYHTGRYGCSALGMVMLSGTYEAADYLSKCVSGSLVEVPMPDRKNPERDPKTDAIVIRL